jgi:hypothetical protein
MESLIVRYPPGCKAVLLKALGEFSDLGVSVENLPEENLYDLAGAGGEKFEQIHGLPYSREERIASVRSAMEDYRAGGRTYTTEELSERVAKW